MLQSEKPLHFFLGANTPQGFVSRFDQLADPAQGWREFILKGGPGTGKSTLLKKLAAQECGAMELIHCSSDAQSLDAVILPERKIAVADGTAPHVLEPRCPGAFEQLVDLSSCWDAQKLYPHCRELMLLSAKISRCHEHCCRFLNAAGSLLGDTCRIAKEATLTQKALKAAERIAQSEFPRVKGTPGTERIRFLSAVTDRGLVLFEETAQTLCDRVYLVEDTYGAASRLLLGSLRSSALESGLDILSCYCPLAPFEKLEHLFIPSLRLGFLTANSYHQPQLEPFKVLRAHRFTDPEALQGYRRRIHFNKKAASQLLDEAAGLLCEAKALHDQLENYYIAAMDFQKVDALSAQLLTTCQALHQN